MLVNPYDPEAVGAAIEQALSMPLDERRSRNRTLFQVLMAHDAKSWGERFLGTLTCEQDDPIGVPWMRTEKLSTLDMGREAEEHSAVD